MFNHKKHKRRKTEGGFSNPLYRDNGGWDVLRPLSLAISH